MAWEKREKEIKQKPFKRGGKMGFRLWFLGLKVKAALSNIKVVLGVSPKKLTTWQQKLIEIKKDHEKR